MKHCAGCGAPNPQHLMACYSCGRTLDQAAPPPVKTYPCRACEQPIPFAAPVCPHCGLAVQAEVPSHGAVHGMALADFSRMTDALQQASTLGSIGDWEIEPLPDGTTRLKRGFWARLSRAGATNVEEGAALVIFGMGALYSLGAASRWPKPAGAPTHTGQASAGAALGRAGRGDVSCEPVRDIWAGWLPCLPAATSLRKARLGYTRQLRSDEPSCNRWRRSRGTGAVPRTYHGLELNPELTTR